MTFGMVSGVGGGMCVIDGVHCLKRKGRFWGFGVPIHPIGLNGVLLYATSKL